MEKMPALLGFSLLLLLGCASQPSQPAACTMEARLCPDGSYVGRNSSLSCAFNPCPASQNNAPPTACTMEARLCPDGSSVGRNLSNNCEFDPCPAQNAVAPAGEGRECAGTNGIKCAQGLQCITSGQPGAIGTCTRPSPQPKDLQQCPADRAEFCTLEYNPVCGRLVGGGTEVAGYRDYGNACQACSKSSNAIGYYFGTCASRGF